MTPKQLREQFSYQFSYPMDEGWYSFPRGWFPIFANLCRQIDELLGEDKRGFHWKQTKEKFGTARFYWAMKGHRPFNVDVIGVARLTTKPPKGNKLAAQIGELVSAAEDATHSACIACGAPGELDRRYPWLLTLCKPHTEERKKNRDSLSVKIYLGDGDDVPAVQ